MPQMGISMGASSTSMASVRVAPSEPAISTEGLHKRLKPLRPLTSQGLHDLTTIDVRPREVSGLTFKSSRHIERVAAQQTELMGRVAVLCGSLS